MDATRRELFAMAGGAVAAAALAGCSAAQGARKLGSDGKELYWVATCTPCDANGAFQPNILKDIMQFHKEAGADGVVVLGTSGEFPSFSVAERKQVAEAAMQNKNGMNIIIGPGTSNIAETIDLAKHAESIGADGLLVIPPFYFRNPPVDGLTDYYSMLFDQVGMPINLYHILDTSEVPISIDLIKNLYHYQNLVGIKDSSGDQAGYLKFLEAFPDLNMRTGTGNNIEPAVAHGMGAILAEGNTFSAACANVYKAARAGGDWHQPLDRLLAALRSLSQDVRGAGFAPDRSYIMSLQLGGPEFYSRPPFGKPSEDAKAAMKAAYEKAKATLA